MQLSNLPALNWLSWWAFQLAWNKFWFFKCACGVWSRSWIYRCRLFYSHTYTKIHRIIFDRTLIYSIFGCSKCGWHSERCIYLYRLHFRFHFSHGQSVSVYESMRVYEYEIENEIQLATGWMLRRILFIACMCCARYISSICRPLNLLLCSNAQSGPNCLVSVTLLERFRTTFHRILIWSNPFLQQLVFCIVWLGLIGKNYIVVNNCNF